MPLHSLLYHFNWWDDFINRWLHGEDPEPKYLPEPWWGWSPKTGLPLYSVCINISPGDGGAAQQREIMTAVLGAKPYSEAMRDGTLSFHLGTTHGWHCSQRADVIGSYLPEYPVFLNNHINHHLSIELCTMHNNDMNQKEYVDKTKEESDEHIIKFAASAARRVMGVLKNTVIVRCAASRFIDATERYGYHPSPQEGANIKSPYAIPIRFDDDVLQDIDFVCMAGARNKLPRKMLKKLIESKYNLLTKKSNNV